MDEISQTLFDASQSGVKKLDLTGLNSFISL